MWAIQEGVEPSTCGVRIRRSNQLSYRTGRDADPITRSDQRMRLRLVPRDGFEPPTPTPSTKRSTTELPRQDSTSPDAPLGVPGRRNCSAILGWLECRGRVIVVSLAIRMRSNGSVRRPDCRALRTSTASRRCRVERDASTQEPSSARGVERSRCSPGKWALHRGNAQHALLQPKLAANSPLAARLAVPRQMCVKRFMARDQEAPDRRASEEGVEDERARVKHSMRRNSTSSITVRRTRVRRPRARPRPRGRRRPSTGAGGRVRRRRCRGRRWCARRGGAR